MAWSVPATAIAGSVLTAAWLNTYLRDNMTELRNGGMAIAGQAAGDIITATSATQLGRSTTIPETQIADGSILARNAANEIISGTWTFGAASGRGILVSRGGSVDAGIQFTNGLTSYAVVNDSTGVLRIQDDTDGSPRIEMNGTDIGLVGGTTTVTGSVQVTGRYNSANAQPGFYAYASGTATNVGNGTGVSFDTELLDGTSSFASSTFTAPVAGIYVFGAGSYITDLAASDSAGLDLITTGAGYRLSRTTVTATQHAGVQVVSMNQGDTALIQLHTTDGTGVTLNGGLSSPRIMTYFFGRLLC